MRHAAVGLRVVLDSRDLIQGSRSWRSKPAGHFPFPNYKIYYPGAVWYSLPGPCPSRNYTELLGSASTNKRISATPNPSNFVPFDRYSLVS